MSDSGSSGEFSDFSGASDLEIGEGESPVEAPSKQGNFLNNFERISFNLDQLNSSLKSSYFHSSPQNSTVVHIQIPFEQLNKSKCNSEYQLKAWDLLASSSTGSDAVVESLALSIVLHFKGGYQNSKFAIGISSLIPEDQPFEQELLHFVTGFSANHHDLENVLAKKKISACLLSWSLANILDEKLGNLLYHYDLSGDWEQALDYATSDRKDKVRLELESSRYPLLLITEFAQFYLSVAATRCIVCHSAILSGVELLKPTTCSQFCLFRLITYDIGQDISEYVLKKAKVVDLMISLAYAASSGGHDTHSQFKIDTFPCGVGYNSSDGKFVGFEQSKTDYTLLTATLDKLPSLKSMREYLMSPEASLSEKNLYRTPSLKHMLDPIDRLLYPLLRWIIHSNPCHIRAIDSSSSEALVGLPLYHHQFEIVMSSPSKASKFQKLKQASSNQSLFAFHGSAVQNWFTILHKGLNYNNVKNGRAYGNGIYHSLLSSTSAGYSAAGVAGTVWKESVLELSSVMSLNEIVHTESFFTSKTPHLVINQVDAVECRYLIVCSQYVKELADLVPQHANTSYLVHHDSYKPFFGATVLLIPISPITTAKPIGTPNFHKRKFTNTSLDEPEKKQVLQCLICAEDYNDVMLYWTLLKCCGKKVCTDCFTRLTTTRPDMSRVPCTFFKCPFCSFVEGVEIGTCGEGKMEVQVFGEWIHVSYYVTQQPYQTSRLTYFPNTPQGRRVVELMRVAWQRRLVFNVGTSMTTGQGNVSVWNIHHKTAISGGPAVHGYPDNGYLDRVTAELAERGVL